MSSLLRLGTRALVIVGLTMACLSVTTPALAAVGDACSATVPCTDGLVCTSGACAAAAAGSTETEPAPPPTRTPGEFGYRNPLGNVSVNTLIGRLIRTALGFVGALFLLMFVYGGATWMLAGGEEKKVKSGQQTLMNAIIGMVIVAISYSVVSIIFETANVVRG